MCLMARASHTGPVVVGSAIGVGFLLEDSLMGESLAYSGLLGE